MLDADYLNDVVRVMRERGIDFAPGLTNDEVAAAEAALGTRFPPDLATLLRHALPRGERFPDWREPGSAHIKDAMAWPADGICFDIEHDDFWLPEWGERPASLEDAKARAREEVARAPVLIPIHAHRYLPAAPCREGNPVFSVWQTDVIVYGMDLPSYLHAEFGVPNPFDEPEYPPREIELWCELERRNG